MNQSKETIIKVLVILTSMSIIIYFFGNDLIKGSPEEKISMAVTFLWFIPTFAILFLGKDKNLATLLGIFGTFFGILIGLNGFNEKDIDGSIPLLLNGLKTAFLTSIVGLTVSVTLSIIEKFKVDDTQKDDKDIFIEIKNELISLNKNVGGDGDSSLLSQIQKLRTAFSDKQDELKKSFDEFAREMSENNMKALTESMKKFMEDFNAKINDQLGQSFKELTTAIDNLLKWQEEYKKNIVSSTEALNLSKESLEKSSKGFEITVEKAERFSGISENLGNEIKTLSSSLEIFKNGINEFEGVSKTTKEMADSMIQSIDSLSKNFISKAETLVQESEKHIKLITDTFSEQSEELTDAHKDLLNTLKRNIEESNRRIAEQLENIGNELEKQAIKLDDELGNALNKSLTSLGKELTSITNRFTQQLTELNNVIKK